MNTDVSCWWRLVPAGNADPAVAHYAARAALALLPDVEKLLLSWRREFPTQADERAWEAQLDDLLLRLRPDLANTPDDDADDDHNCAWCPHAKTGEGLG